MKKPLIFNILFLLVAFSVYADEQVGVKLSDETPKQIVKFANCNIVVTKNNTDYDGNSKVSVEIENRNESGVVLLFGHAYPEKDLRRQTPSIRFDKRYPKTSRNIETFNGDKNVLFVETAEKRFLLPGIQIGKDEKYSCRLPLYFAKYKPKSFWSGSDGRNKLLILERQILELEIEVKVKPDEDYVRLEAECKTLIEEISNQTFCPNPKHKPSLDRQKASYLERKSNIVAKIDSIIHSHKWFSTDTGYQLYNGLKQKLGDVTFSETDCGKHPRVGPVSVSQRCKYCNLSPQQIFHKLDDYYKKIYSSSNRKATKDGVMADVNILYNCSNHSGTWKKSEYKSKIEDRYTRINNF